MLVTIAANCMTSLAKGLRKKFYPYASQSLEACCDRFKEKKVTVATALSDATDAIFLTVCYLITSY